ncbi:GntR family transcriptional regulator [Nesterenkonia sp. NBAIMH1]|uniref:GntR family transcriptional regulator n=1 Tax=Nesterenkonia sp. NBAIMH1 TaxID=2600320 RepID=UPI0011B683C2|nr:GntR family transcriptional regulator [Nesterenkonia sp. NBAIMH1]
MTRAEEIEQRLLRLLSEGEFRPGERIGTERSLAEQLDVSRSLLRQGLERLENQQRLRRSMGRTGGVFADDGKIQRHLNTVQGVPEMVRRQGLTVRTTVIRAELASPSPSEQRALEMQGSSPVFRIVRIRHAGSASWSLDTSVLPARRFPRLLSQDLTVSLYRLLGREYELTIDRAEETVEATQATREQAEELEIPMGAGLLEIHRVTYDECHLPVEYAHDLFRADRTRIHTQKVGSSWKRARNF